MAFEQEPLITVNEPFRNLNPLTDYLAKLDMVTTAPSEQTIADLELADKTLTDRAVLFPHFTLAPGTGYRIYGYKPCTASDGVLERAHGALTDPAANPLERRLNNARVALITLGGHIAVSGAFFERDIEPAYEAIKATMENIGERSEEEKYASFGIRRISRDLLNQLWDIRHFGANQNPIGKREAESNIETAWQVVGRPYGRFAKVMAGLASRPHF